MPVLIRSGTGTLYAKYLAQHNLLPPPLPPPPPPHSVVGLAPPVPPPPFTHLADRSHSVSSPMPIPSSPFSPSTPSPCPSSYQSPAALSSPLPAPPPPLRAPPPPVPLFHASSNPLPPATPVDPSSSPPSLPTKPSSLRTHRPPPLVPSLPSTLPPNLSPPPLPPSLAVTPPQAPTLPSNAFSTHLHHVPDVITAHAQASLLLTKRCRSFFHAYAALQARHAADVERLVAHEMGKLTGLSEEDLGGAGRVWQSLLMKVGMQAVLQSGLGSDVSMQCGEVLERFEQVGLTMSRDYDAEVKRHTAAMDRVQVMVAKEREVTRQALASLAHRKERGDEGLAGHAAAMLSGGVDGARRKALRCCEGYMRVIDTANVAHQLYHQHELPTLLTQVQSLEEMRLQSTHAALSTFASLHSAHSKALIALSGDIKGLVSSISAEQDVKDFIARTIQQHGPPLPSQPFAFDCSITANELKQEIDAEEKAAPQATSHPAIPKPRPSLFYASLEGVIEYEKATLDDAKEGPAAVSATYPSNVPRILPVLIAAIEELGGPTSEGIFRLSVSSDELHAVRKRLEGGDYRLSNVNNPHVPAAVLKAWLRDLSSPLIPFACYERAIELGKVAPSSLFDSQPPHPQLPALLSLLQSIPPLNRRVLFYLLCFLHRLTLPPCVEQSRMTQFNLAVVFAPTLLRSEGNEAVAMLQQSKHACGFIQLLMDSVGRGGVGWEEERAWKARAEVSANHPTKQRGSVPPPLPAEFAAYLSPHHSPPPSPGVVGGRVQSSLSFAEQHAAHAPRPPTPDAAAAAVVVHGLAGVKGRAASEWLEGKELPAHWQATLDPASGEVYYFSTVTGETQWTRPGGDGTADRMA